MAGSPSPDEPPAPANQPDRRPFPWPWKTLVVAAAIGVLLAFALGWQPPGAKAQGLEPDRVAVGIGIFACIALLWLTEALPLAVTALLVPVLAVICGVSELREVLPAFAHPLIFLFLGGFALAAALARQGIDAWIARYLVRLGRGHFLAVSLLLFAASAFLSMWMSNTATTAMMIPLILGILGSGWLARRTPSEGKSQTPLPTEEVPARNALFLLLGCAYSASIGGIGTLIGSPPNAFAADELDLSFLDWMRWGVPAVALLLPLMVVILWLLFRPDSNRRLNLEESTFNLTPARITTLVVFALTALSWIFSRQLAGLLDIGRDIDSWIALSAIVLLVTSRVVCWQDIRQGTDWSVLLLFGGGIALSGLLGSTGASVYLANSFTAVIGSWPTILVVAGVVFFIVFLTELSSNTATTALMVPIFAVVAGQLGMGAAELVVPLAIGASCAFMLPVATPPNALVFATDRVPQAAMMRAGFVLNLACGVTLVFLARWLG